MPAWSYALGTAITGVAADNGRWTLHAADGDHRPLRRQRGRPVLGHASTAVRPSDFAVAPRRGELIVFDKLARAA